MRHIPGEPPPEGYVRLDGGAPFHFDFFRIGAESALARGFWLSQCAHAARYEVIHGAKNMAEDHRQQRNAILTIAAQLFDAASQRETTEGMKEWRQFLDYKPE